MDVAVETLDVLLQPIRDCEDTTLLYKAHTALPQVSLLVQIHHVYIRDIGVVLFYHRIIRSLSSVF